MTFEVRDNSGALFQAKKGSDKAPDYTGECLVNGQKMQIAGWRKTSAKGTAYLSLKFQSEGEQGVRVPEKKSNDEEPF